MTDIPNPKDVVGAGKPSMRALPRMPLFEISATFNVADYGLFNWRDKPVSLSGHLDAMDRHMAEVREGRDYDGKSQKRHLAHIAATAIILLDAMDHGTLIDDRWKPKANQREYPGDELLRSFLKGKQA